MTRVVVPIPILNGSTLVSSDASAASDPAAYVSGTTYASAVRVVYNDTIYESLQGTNTGHQPDTSPTWWAKIQPINKLCMFDASVSTKTANANSLTVSIKPGQSFDTLALHGVDGSTITVTQTDPVDGTVYTETQDLTIPVGSIYPFYDYVFAPLARKAKALFTGFRSYPNSTVTVTISKSGGTVKCGLLVVGYAQIVGGAEYGATDSITDYSIVQTDQWGVRDIVVRDYADDAEFSMQVSKEDSQTFRDALASVRATPVLIVLADARPEAQYYGLVSFKRTFSFWDTDIFTITMKGFT